jgi:hypothetical protein
MSPKATNNTPPPVPTISGKWLIIGVLSVAVVGAGGSWWFRYSSTHQAALFWGPHSAPLIRDAPRVDFYRDQGFDSSIKIRNVTAAQGLVHLRNALLEDRSYQWPANPSPAGARWEWVLIFRDDDANQQVELSFSPKCKFVATSDRSDTILSCEPIAAGLREMFAEFAAAPSAQPATPAR